MVTILTQESTKVKEDSDFLKAFHFLLAGTAD